jgi:hypothetical protein
VSAPASDTGDGAGSGPTPEVDPDLVAWQEYLRSMEADERRQAGAD